MCAKALHRVCKTIQQPEAVCTVLTHAHDELANRNADNEKDKTHSITLSLIILLGFCNVTALLKAVVRCFLHVTLSVPFLSE